MAEPLFDREDFMPGRLLRFAVGSPEEQFSSVWRLWTNRSDAYFASRTSAGLFKLSMHESGQWIVAFTSESKAVFQDTGSRRHKTWRRPSEFRPGWTQGPTLFVPWVEWRGEFRPLRKAPPDTVWVPGPAPNRNLMFLVFFSAPGVPPDEISSVSLSGDLIVGNVPLANGETVWVQAREAAMSPEDQNVFASIERQFMGFTASDLDAIEPWGLWVTESVGRPLLIEFPLGRRHFQGTPQS